MGFWTVALVLYWTVAITFAVWMLVVGPTKNGKTWESALKEIDMKDNPINRLAICSFGGLIWPIIIPLSLAKKIMKLLTR